MCGSLGGGAVAVDAGTGQGQSTASQALQGREEILKHLIMVLFTVINLGLLWNTL